MEELSDLIKQLGLNNVENSSYYELIDIFKNPQKLPINQVHLEKPILKLKKTVNLDLFDASQDARKFYEQSVTVLPALDPIWVPFTPPNYQFVSDETDFIVNNQNYLQLLTYLLKCNYHQFWCLVLFKPEISDNLASFLVKPIVPHQNCLKDDDFHLYQSILNAFLLVYQRLITCKQSEFEYMSETTLLKYLLELKLINLPIVVTLNVIYERFSQDFTNKLNDLYFFGGNTEHRLFVEKEVEQLLSELLICLEMIGGRLCGFEENPPIIPIGIEEKPKVFSIDWTYSIVNYLLNTVISLKVLLQCYKPSQEMAFKKTIPFRLSYFYDKIYANLYEMLDERKELKKDLTKSLGIYEEISMGRSVFIDIFHLFVSNCLNKALEEMNDQEEIVEIYLKLLNSALEDEYFICDYNAVYDISAQNEIFTSCTNIDKTRADYILTCLESFPRHNKLWKALKFDKETLRKTIERYSPNKTCLDGIFTVPMEKNNQLEEEPSSSKEFNGTSEEEIEEKIRIVIDMFPHLGDGFVMKCLETYNYQTNEVIGAILEENLPPNIMDIPFDLIRIPPEPKPVSPILAYRGKKPDYDDALKLLNDKKDMKQIKTYVMDGLQYTDEYDVYDDEYDDREDEETIPVPAYGEDVLKYNPNYDDDVVSDTSHSENEYDEKGELINEENKGNSRDFCVNPEILRERQMQRHQERNFKKTGNKSIIENNKKDVVGKPKGQGQEKNVLANRHKKNVNKSSKANHNRKSGAQWKRSKGMMPF